jgi:calcium-dependent protein kinase
LLRDLIRRILVPVDKRLTLDQILEHPWVKANIEKPLKLKLDFNRMKRVTRFSKLKAMVVAFLCAQFPAKEIEPLAELFKSIDTNNDGFLSVTEMENALNK